MIIPDTNLLLYAEIAAFPEHAAARKWWEAQLSGSDEVGLPGPVIFAFLRIATNPRVLSPPLAVNAALDRVNAWLAQPNVRALVPGPNHLTIAFDLLRSLGTAGNLTTDTQIAASAIEHGATVCSNDTDFGRFAGLAVQNPLRP